MHREAPWAEGPGSRVTLPGPASRGWLSRVPREQSWGWLFAALSARCRALFPCAASLQCPDLQQREAAIQGALEPAALAVNAGNPGSQLQPHGLHILVFFPLETCNKCSAGPRGCAPTASLPHRGGRDGEFLAAPFPAHGDLHFDK